MNKEDRKTKIFNCPIFYLFHQSKENSFNTNITNAISIYITKIINFDNFFSHYFMHFYSTSGQ